MSSCPVCIRTVLLSLAICAAAEDRPSFSTLGPADGLPNSSVSSIVQDQKGFLWFGTQGGLVRYDGYAFKRYENEPFADNVLSHNQVQTLFLDGEVLWVGTYGGLNRLDLKTDRIVPYLHDPDDPNSLGGNLVTTLERDAAGRLWVGSSEGLDRLDEETGVFTHYPVREADPRALPHQFIRDLHRDATGTLWIGTSGGSLARYEPGTDDFLRIPGDAGNPAALPSRYVMSIAETEDGELWFGTWFGGISRLKNRQTLEFETLKLPDDRIYFVSAIYQDRLYIGTWGGGLFAYTPSTGAVDRYRSTDGPGSIGSDVVYSAFLDSNNVSWIGTNGGGVSRSERKDLNYTMFLHDPEKPGSLAPGKVTSILEDRVGALWVGVYNGGLNRLDQRTGIFRHYRHDSQNRRSLPDDIVNSMYEDRRGVLWVSTNGGLARYDRGSDDFTVFRYDPDDPDSLADNVVYCVEESPEGDLWVGTYTRGLDRLERSSGRFVHYTPRGESPNGPLDALVFDLEYDRQGQLWIGCNNGLDRLKDGVFNHYTYDRADTAGISSNAIRHLFRDSRGTLWLGSVGGGLMRYDDQADSFMHITKKQGLIDNTVRSILEDGDGKLWVGTSTGIGFINKSTSYFRGYSVYNDLKDREFHTGAFRGRDGFLYFGGQGAVYRLNPVNQAPRAKAPRLLVSEIFINGLNIAQDDGYSVSAAYVESLDLKYDANNVMISFAVVDFRAPGRNLYSYKLEGFDDEWSQPSTNNTATYTNLPGAEYTLRIRAADNDGIWNDEALALPLRVGMPPWLTPGAFVAYFAVLVGIGYLIATLRTEGRMRAKIVELTQVKAGLEAANRRLDEISTLDALTGLSNRRRLDLLFPLLAADGAREKKNLSVLMLDIDFFKNYNDRYGHPKGDDALVTVAGALKKSLERATDFIARYGGEEFIAVLPNTDSDGAGRVAERMRRAVESLGVPNEGSTISRVVTISAGIATGIPDPSRDGFDLIEAADQALYQAKSQGRNRVV